MPWARPFRRDGHARVSGVQAASRAGRKDLLRVTDMSPDMASGLVSWGVSWELINRL